MIATDFNNVIRKILRCLKREKLNCVLSEWGVIEKDGVTDILQNQAFKTKKAVVEGLLDVCKSKKITKKNVAELDLIYRYHNSESKQWSVFQIVHKSDQHPVLQTKEFEGKLREQLSFYFKHDLCIKRVGEALWLRIGIHEGISTQIWLPSNVIYIVHHPRSHYIFISKIKVGHRDYLMQALLCTLQCIEVKQLQLTGHSVDSLADLVLHQQSQGGFAKYRLNQVHASLLTSRKSRKRKATSEIDPVDVAVTYENTKEKANQQRLTEEAFGSHQQPKLQKLEYRLETRFRGTNFVPGMAMRKDEPFHCKVKFEGTSVLEGIKELCSKGLASYPLPYHLSDVHSLAKNHFVLADKKKTTFSGNEEVEKRTSRRARTLDQ